MTSHSTARRPRARKGAGEQLRGEIIAAARAILDSTGDANSMSIRAVAERVGVTPPSIYLHFADKDALIDAVVADSFATLSEMMQQAIEGVKHPLERLCQQGLAYVRFAKQCPEHYRLATENIRSDPSEADRVLGTTAITLLSQTITECMDAGIFAQGDTVPIVLELWAAAHGIASLLVAKPFLPWGDVEEAATRVLRNAAVGRAIADAIGEDNDGPAAFAAWLADLKRA